MTRKIVFLGDIALQGLACEADKNLLDPELEKIIQGDTIVVGNVEFTSEVGKPKIGQPRLLGSQQDILLLKQFHLNIALLANNHSFDCGEVGFKKCTSLLEKMNITWVGAGFTETEARQPKIIEEKKILIVNYADTGTHPIFSSDGAPGVNRYDTRRVVEDLSCFSKTEYFKIVAVHAGCQYYTLPENRLRVDARMFIEAGAHIVLFNHSHVIVGHEIINGNLIDYGLGNSFFNDFSYIDESGNIFFESPKLKTRRSAACCVLIDERGNGYKIKYFYLYQNDNKQLCFNKNQKPFLYFSIFNKFPFYRAVFMIYKIWRELPVRGISLVVDIFSGKRKFRIGHIKRLFRTIQYIVNGRGDNT